MTSVFAHEGSRKAKGAKPAGGEEYTLKGRQGITRTRREAKDGRREPWRSACKWMIAGKMTKCLVPAPQSTP